MSASAHPEDSSQNPSFIERIEQACDRFEAAWRAGLRPRIEDALAVADGPARAALLRELLLIDLSYRLRQGERPVLDDYLARFPDDGEVVRAAFAAAVTGNALRSARRVAAEGVAENLLLGLLALQNNFVSRERLLAAFNAWVADKARPLGQVLCDQGTIDAGRLALLEALVGEHLKIHGGDPGESLAALSSLGSVREDLEKAADPDVRSCLGATMTRVAGAGGGAGAKTGPASGNRRAGSRFRVLRFHRRGGLGEVYVARDEELGREVALKEIRPDKADAGQLRARFVLEAEINGGLEHPGIVPVYSLGSYDDGRPFYAMRFVDGDSLDEGIKAYHASHPQPDPAGVEFRKLLGRFVDVCEAIAFAHSKGVLHRDLKPHNVMLGRYGETLLIDWGLAKAMGRRAPADPDDARETTLVPASGGSHEPTVGVIGSPAYMSPEQAVGTSDALGPATDVYGLGAILYALLTGAPPVSGRTRDDVLDRVRLGAIAPPRQVNPRVPAPLEAACLKALALCPEDRYTNARALADDVERWLADEPVTAWREPITVRARRWTRRHRVAVTSASASLVVALIGLSAILALREQANRELADKNLRLEHAVQGEREAGRELADSNRRLRATNQLALGAIESFYSGASEGVFEQVKLEPVRAGILQTALDFYQDLETHLRESHDPASQSDLADAYAHVALIHRELGSYLEALKAYQKSLAIREALVRDEPGNPQHLRDLALSENFLGLVYERFDRREGLRYFGLARDIRERLTQEHPDVDLYWFDLARSYTNIGNVQRLDGHPEEASRLYRRALEILERLARGHPLASRPRTVTTRAGGLVDLLQQFALGSPRPRRPHHRAVSIRALLGGDESVLDILIEGGMANNFAGLGYLEASAGHAEEALRLQRRALEIRERLAAAYPEEDYFLPGQLAGNYETIGSLQRRAGRQDEAIALYQKALTIREQAVKARPAYPKFRQDLAHTLRAFGDTYWAVGQTAGALLAHRRARDIIAELSSEELSNLNLLAALGESHTIVGELQEAAGGHDEALRSHQGAVALRERVAREKPGDAESQSLLVLSYARVGWLHHRAGHGDESVRSYRSALAVHERLAREAPGDPSRLRDLALSHFSLGFILHAIGRRDEARASYQDALAIRERLASSAPDDSRSQSDLAWSYLQLGGLEREAGRAGEALASYRRAATVLEGLPRPQALDLYNLACSLSVSSALAVEMRTASPGVGPVEGRALADRAMTALRRAVAAGYKDFVKYREDPDLNPLRHRDDFRALIMDCLFPEWPFEGGPTGGPSSSASGRG
jgi:serine/threonine-protein kinase